MKRVLAFIRPHQLEPVKAAIANLGVTGLTLTDVRGTGNSRSHPEESSTSALRAMPLRTRIEVVVSDDLVESTIKAILENAQTGQQDDGKIFVEQISNAFRIRTGESGDSAV